MSFSSIWGVSLDSLSLLFFLVAGSTESLASSYSDTFCSPRTFPRALWRYHEARCSARVAASLQYATLTCIGAPSGALLVWCDGMGYDSRGQWWGSRIVWGLLKIPCWTCRPERWARGGRHCGVGYAVGLNSPRNNKCEKKTMPRLWVFLAEKKRGGCVFTRSYRNLK